MAPHVEVGRHRGERTTRWSLATLVGAAGVVAFNVIIGVFGERSAIVGLAIFVVTSLFVIRRSARSGEHDRA